MPKKMRTTRNLLLMATLLGSALFARAADKEMTIGAIYLRYPGILRWSASGRSGCGKRFFSTGTVN